MRASIQDHRLSPRAAWRYLLGLALLVAACGGAQEPAGHEESGEEGHGEHEEGATEIRVTPAFLESAGIRTVAAGPARMNTTLRLTATVVDNLDAQVHINPKVGGVVHVIHVKLGETVAKGDPLCEIDSVELGNAMADYLKALAVADAAKDTLEKRRQLFDKQLETQNRVLDGAIEIAKAIFLREKDLKDRELTTLRPYLEAEKAYKEALFARERDMTSLEAQRDERLLELSVALRTATVELESAENRLHILGMDHRQVAAVRNQQDTLLGRYTVRAPSSGIITGREATQNEFVDTDSVIFRIDNLERSWIEASVYEKDLAAVRNGQEATIRLNAFPGTTFRGVVTYVSHAIDPRTRAARVRIELDNRPIPQWKEPFPIRPGMFGIVELTTSSVDVAIAVPVNALVRDGDEEFVFVNEGGETFLRREVRIGRRSAARIEILAGLKAGDEVATAGTFELKSLLQSAKLGAGDSH